MIQIGNAYDDVIRPATLIMRPNDLRIHVARSRHIILVERGRSGDSLVWKLYAILVPKASYLRQALLLESLKSQALLPL